MDEVSKEIGLSTELAPILVITLFLVIVAIGIIMLVLLYQKKQIQNSREKEQLKVLFEKEILESKLEIQEQTFKNISQEIHDNIGQVLILARLTVNAMECNDQNNLKERIGNTNELLGKALQDLRNLSKSLNAENIAEIGLVKSIANEVELIKKTGKYNVNLKLEEISFALSHQHEVIVFRIFQEILNNIIKHSNATEINVEMAGLADRLVLQVADNGQGFDPFAEKKEAQPGSGIRNMKNRASMIGAHLSLTSEVGNGTVITMTLPKKNETT